MNVTAHDGFPPSHQHQGPRERSLILPGLRSLCRGGAEWPSRVSYWRGGHVDRRAIIVPSEAEHRALARQEGRNPTLVESASVRQPPPSSR